MEKERKWPVEKYSKLKNGVWVEIPLEKGNCCLLLKGTQLYLINEKIAIESVCLIGGAGLVKSSYATENIGFSISSSQKNIYKFKIRLADCFGKVGAYNCLEVVQELRKFIPVIQHPSHTGPKLNEATTMVKTLPELAKEILVVNPDIVGNSELVLSEESIPETIQQCLLDPGFSALVGKVENLLKIQTEED